jgi:hypothetical protein
VPAATKPVVATPRAASSAEATILDTTGFNRTGWKTDFSKHTVPLSEIQSGGPPRDGIPPIDRPAFVDSAVASEWLADNEPVVVYEENGDARAYPLQILIWHEIVNDTVGGRPVTVTFCPLCNTAIAFDRRLDGVTYDFGTTGNLRRSDLVMWDRQTESWWQQITGEAIVGALAGARLTPVPAAIQSFAAFRAAFPNGRVLSRETGVRRDYGRHRYAAELGAALQVPLPVVPGLRVARGREEGVQACGEVAGRGHDGPSSVGMASACLSRATFVIAFAFRGCRMPRSTRNRSSSRTRDPSVCSLRLRRKPSSAAGPGSESVA